MSSFDCPFTERPLTQTRSPADSPISPTPPIMRSLSFPPMDTLSDGSMPSIPTPYSMSMSDAQWLAAVRSNARKLYLRSSLHKIPCVKPRENRVVLECDSDDDDEDEDVFNYNFDNMSDATTLVGTPSEGSICSDAKEDADVVAKLSDKETADSTMRVKGLLQKLSPKIPNKDGSLPSEPSSDGTSPTEVDWTELQQLEMFLACCVQGWEMQAQYIAQQRRMQNAMRKMQKRMAATEDQAALLAWYANHLKGGDTSSPPLPADILKEAEAAVLKQATSTMASAADALEKSA
ncbi:Golgi apyrase [Sporothrix stenoceras]|uniref:Golgi apyrase n=1 Tax=Sporothrix stenoceras TaxID=5173 RepID=A0ABR3ZR32_9PEZI